MLRLARQCGISTAESRTATLGGKDVLLTKRFDREKTKGGYTRARMISGLTVLRADEGVQTRPRTSAAANNSCFFKGDLQGEDGEAF